MHYNDNCSATVRRYAIKIKLHLFDGMAANPCLKVVNEQPAAGSKTPSMQIVQAITDTKKPAGLVPCGLSGLHRMTLVITDGEFWWLAESELVA